MTTFTKAKLKKSDGQTNTEKYRVAAHKLFQNIRAKTLLSLFYYLVSLVMLSKPPPGSVRVKRSN